MSIHHPLSSYDFCQSCPDVTTRNIHFHYRRRHFIEQRYSSVSNVWCSDHGDNQHHKHQPLKYKQTTKIKLPLIVVTFDSWRFHEYISKNASSSWIDIQYNLLIVIHPVGTLYQQGTNSKFIKQQFSVQCTCNPAYHVCKMMYVGEFIQTLLNKWINKNVVYKVSQLLEQQPYVRIMDVTNGIGIRR